MISNRNAVVFGTLAAIAMVAATVLVCLGHPVPEFLSTIAIAAVAALAGVSLPTPPAPVASAPNIGTALAVPPADS